MVCLLISTMLIGGGLVLIGLVGLACIAGPFDRIRWRK